MSISQSQENDGFFSNCFFDLKSKKEQLTPTEYRYAKETIKAIYLLWQEKEPISSIPNETERNRKITDITKLIAEPGLIPGTTAEEINKSISIRVSQLKAAYLYDKKKNESLFFFMKAFVGPPCFNGRVITLQNYILERQGYKPERFYEYQTGFDEEACKLEEVMYQCVEKYELEDGKPPSLEQLKKFTGDFPKDLKRNFIDLYSENICALYNRAREFYVE